MHRVFYASCALLLLASTASASQWERIGDDSDALRFHYGTGDLRCEVSIIPKWREDSIRIIFYVITPEGTSLVETRVIPPQTAFVQEIQSRFDPNARVSTCEGHFKTLIAEKPFAHLRLQSNGSPSLLTALSESLASALEVEKKQP